MNGPILIAGIGNIFLGDDGFGVEVVRRLSGRELPDGVRVVDFGIRGFDFAQALLDGYEAVIVIDAAATGRSPGALTVIEPSLCDRVDSDFCDPRGFVVDAHSFDPARVFECLLAQGENLPPIRIVACEPATLSEEHAFELSPPVQNAVQPAVELVERLMAEVWRSADEQLGERRTSHA